MEISKMEVEIELKSNAEIFWSNLREYTTFLPKALPDVFQINQVVQGDEISAGAVFSVTIKADPHSSVTSSAKEMIELVDDEKKTLCYSVLEGEIMNYYKTFKSTVHVIPNGDGSLVKYSNEFEKVNQESPDPEFVRDFVSKLYHDLDAYLLKA